MFGSSLPTLQVHLPSTSPFELPGTTVTRVVTDSSTSLYLGLGVSLACLASIPGQGVP